MERREFLKTLGIAGGLAALGCEHAAGPAAAGPNAGDAAGSAPVVGSQSRRAWADLLALLAEADTRYLGAEWGIERPADVADGHRFLMHAFHSGIEQWLESDPLRPKAVRFVTPTLKLLGDNPDALYYTAPIDPKRRYRVRGNSGGAVYTSITIEGGNAEGHYPKRVAGAINDTEFDVARDGRFEVVLGPDEKSGRNRLALEPDAGTLTTRHYFETVKSAAIHPPPGMRLEVELFDPMPAPPTPSDESIAAGIRRVTNYLQGVTLGLPRPDPSKQPGWVSAVPNQFNPPAKWQPSEGGFGAVDNAYCMAPYVVLPDQALVIEGRWPKGRFGNVMLWNRFMQTYDYVNRRVSLNRRQTRLERDGSFRIVVAHHDPGTPNWLDAEGRISGLIFWRFQLPEGDLPTPKAKLVPLAEIMVA